MAIKCALEPTVAAMKINSYLYANPKISNLDSFYNNMAKLLFSVEGDLRHVIEGYKVGNDDSNFGSYLPRLVAVIKGQAAALESELGRGNSDFTALSGTKGHIIADNIGTAVLNKIVEESKPAVTVETIEKRDEEVSFIDGNIRDFFLDEELGNKRTSVLVDGTLSHERFAELYFKDFPDSLDAFKELFINTFYDNLIETRVLKGATGFNINMQAVMEKSQAELEEGIDEELAGKTDMDQVLLGSSEAVKTYFSQVAVKEFDSLVKIFLPGIKVSKKSGRWEMDTEETVRTSYSDIDGSFSGMDQISAMMKMHVYTTPRLVEDSNGNLKQDSKKPFLSDYELKAIANELNSLPGTRSEFKRALETKMKDSSGETGTILRSFYHKFFSDGTYTVNGEEKVSIDQLAKNGDKDAENIISAFMTAFRSSSRQ
jgi:hypothetical protein